MPRKSSNDEAPKLMTWGKALPVMVVCILFDAVRLMFEQFWFFGPALAGLYCTAKVGAGSVGAAVCSTAATAAGFFAAPAIAAFGVVMAIAVGLFGWMAVGLWNLITNARIFKENAGNALWFVGGLLVSEIPIIGSAPALTGTAWRMYSVQIKKDKEALKQYEEKQQADLQQKRNRQMEQLRAVQAARAEEEAANDAVYAEAANDESTAETASNEEIPVHEKLAA